MDDTQAASDYLAANARWHAPSCDPEPPLGAHLITSRRGYSHHGIYVGCRRVVHYAGLSRRWQSGPVEEVPLSRFIDGRPLRIVAHPEAKYSPEEIVRRARSRLGENDYRLLTNNCEHFCNWCLRGVGRSAQVEERLPFRMLCAILIR
jgi:Lecithin retinol acyltransferase